MHETVIAIGFDSAPERRRRLQELLRDSPIVYRSWSEGFQALTPPREPRLVFLSFTDIDVKLIDSIRRQYEIMNPTVSCVGWSGSPADCLYAIAAGLLCFLVDDEPTDVQRQRINSIVQGELSLPAASVLALLDASSTARSNDIPSTSPLSYRETELLKLLVHGASVREAAMALGVSYNTGVTYIRRLHQKVGVHSRVELIKESDRLLGSSVDRRSR